MASIDGTRPPHDMWFRWVIDFGRPGPHWFWYEGSQR